MDRAGASFSEIAARLTELGVMPHRGKAWHKSQRARHAPFEDGAGGSGMSGKVVDLFDPETMAARREVNELNAMADWLISKDFPENPPPCIAEILEEMER